MIFESQLLETGYKINFHRTETVPVPVFLSGPYTVHSSTETSWDHEFLYFLRMQHSQSSDETFSSIRDVFYIMMIIILHVFPKCTNMKCAMFYSYACIWKTEIKIVYFGYNKCHSLA